MTVHVWSATPVIFAEEALGSFEVAERQRWLEIPSEQARARFATGVHLTRWLVGELLSIAADRVRIDRRCPDCSRAHGRPRVDGAFVSVSHSAGKVVVAGSTMAPLGVDVQAVPGSEAERATARTSLGRTLRPGEMAVLKKLSDAEVVQWWARKEAVAKATGEGIRHGMRSIHVSPPGARAQVVACHDLPGQAMHLRDLELGPGLRGSLCVMTGDHVLVQMRRIGSAGLIGPGPDAA